MKLSKTSRRMALVISAIALLACIGGAIYYRSAEAFSFALGVVLGSLVSVFKLAILERVVDKSLLKEQKAASNYIRLMYLLRYALTGAVLVASVFIPFISLWGTAAGILSLQIAAFSVKFFPQEEDPQPSLEA